MGFWDSMSGQQIYENFANAPGPGSLMASREDLALAESVYTERETQIRTLAASMEAGWTGDAAGAAQRGAGPLAVAHGGAAQEMATAKDLLSGQTDSFYQVKSNVTPVPPAPEEPSTFKNIITLGGAKSDYEDGVAKTNAVAQANVTAMDGWTTASSYNGTMMPTDYGQLDPNAMKVGLVEPTSPPPIGPIPNSGPPKTGGGPNNHEQGPGTIGSNIIPGSGPGGGNYPGSTPGDGRTSGPPQTSGNQTGDGFPQGPGSGSKDGTTSSSFKPPTSEPGSPGWTGGPGGSGWSSGGGQGSSSGGQGGQGGQGGLNGGFGGVPGGTGSGAGGRFGGTGSGSGSGIGGSGSGSGAAGSGTGSEKSLGGGKASGAGAAGAANESTGRGGASAAGTKGTAGRSGMPGGMGGQKGEGGEEDEHQRKYVLDDDEAFQLTEAGERLVDPRTGMPLTPPVIGQ
jgi:hypothetical protein